MSDVAHKYETDDDQKIIISRCSNQLQGLNEQSTSVSNDNNRVCMAEYENACPRRRSSLTDFPDNDQKAMWESGSSEEDNKKFIIMHNPRFSQCVRKPHKPNNFVHNIQAHHSQQRAGGRGVRRLKVVISAKELSELLIKYDVEVAHNSTEAALASLVLEKLSMEGKRSPCENSGVVTMNSARKSTRSTSAVQGNGNYDYYSWRPSLEDIPETFTEEG